MSTSLPAAEADELEHSKMSFREHLEELRGAIIKAGFALVLGTCLGLFFGRDIVAYIQTPLKEALQQHYRGRAQQREFERLTALRDAGKPVPEDLEAAAKAFAERGVTPQVLYVDPREAAKAINESLPGFANDDLLAERPATDDNRPLPLDQMVKLRLYRPLEDDPRTHVIGLQAEEPFMVFIKASVVAGAIIASPAIFFFIWEFVAAGLYQQERKYVYLYLPFSLGLFLAGALLAFYVAFDYVLGFLFQFYAWTETDPSMQLSQWMSFVLLLPLGFGVSFQLPLVMLMLERIGVFSVKDYISKWRLAVVVISVISMFLTPADPGSMLVMGVPLVALYFLGIGLCRWMPGRKLTPAEPASDSTGS